MIGLMTLEEELKNSPNVRKQDVAAILEWTEKQPHLPKFAEVPDIIGVIIAMMIKRRYNSIERAKETLDNYLTFKTIVPELYSNRSVHTPEVKLYLSANYVMVMDKRDAEGNIVFFQTTHDPDTTKYEYNGSVKTLLMVLESWYLENGSGGAGGVTIVFDQRNFTLAHLGRIPLSATRKFNYWTKHCAPLSIKNIHIINCTNAIHAILSAFQPFFQGELFSRIKTYTSSQMEEFYKFVPREAMPNEFGGTAGPIQDLDRMSVKRLERLDDVFKTIDEQLNVDQSKRTGPQKNSNSMFGLEGSFKKLDVD